MDGIYGNFTLITLLLWLKNILILGHDKWKMTILLADKTPDYLNQKLFINVYSKHQTLHGLTCVK